MQTYLYRCSFFCYLRAAVQPVSVLPHWSVCTSNIDYTGTIDSLLGLYPTLIQKYRVLIYNGDVDAMYVVVLSRTL